MSMHDPSPNTASDKSPAFLASEQLLLGIVALQNNLISREQFLAAFDLWVQNKHCRLSEILEQQNAVQRDDRELLERLVGKFLARHGGDVEKSLAEVSSMPDVKSDLERLGDPQIQASLGHVARARAESSAEAATVLFAADSFGRFRILRPHAKGGLGQVSIALDQELHREVALKEILPQHRDRASCERFVQEAEITGALEHPGIVPVYALGHTTDGRPFYAMRFVKGDSLKQAIECFHRSDNSDRKNAGKRHLGLRELLRRFIDVCNAIEYAHSRGVLHRDLKPGNIMVGKYGETLVVDWGLAKAVGKTEPQSDEATLRPTMSLSSSGQTHPGSAIGTPAYMSPEQAAGKLDDLGPVTDVYSLGATLYHLLSGKPPFEGTADEVIPRVIKGDFRRPREVTSEISPALEAICLKSMNLAAKERYQSPRALADDLEHWLADEPITALSETTIDRLGRWSRKYRAWTLSTLGALSLCSIVSILAVVFVERQREIANEQRAIAMREAGRANQAIDKATELQILFNEFKRSEPAVAFEPQMPAEAGAPPVIASVNSADAGSRAADQEKRSELEQKIRKTFLELSADAPQLAAGLAKSFDFIDELSKERKGDDAVTMFLLDCSLSMSQKSSSDASKQRFDVACEGLSQVLQLLHDAATQSGSLNQYQIGFMAFGHRAGARDRDPSKTRINDSWPSLLGSLDWKKDFEILVAPGPLDDQQLHRITGFLDPQKTPLRPFGETPLIGAVAEASRYLIERKHAGNIVVICDGAYNDAREHGAEYQSLRSLLKSNRRLSLYLIAFDLEDHNQFESLRRLAADAGGNIFDVKSAVGITNAVEKASPIPDAPPPP